jgi:soluble lytic murein transglycosylase
MLRTLVKILLIISFISTPAYGEEFHASPEVYKGITWILQYNGYISITEAKEIASMIINEANYHGVPVKLAFSVCAKESHFNVRARSKAGAIGLFQVMPLWIPVLRKYGLHIRSPEDLYKPEINIPAGIIILKTYLRQAKDVERALAYYNAGPTRYKAGMCYARHVLHIYTTLD